MKLFRNISVTLIAASVFGACANNDHYPAPSYVGYLPQVQSQSTGSDQKEKKFTYEIAPYDSLHLGVLELLYHYPYSNEAELIWTGRLVLADASTYYNSLKTGAELFSRPLFSEVVKRSDFPGVVTHFEKEIDISGESLIEAGFPDIIKESSPLIIVWELKTHEGSTVTSGEWNLAPVVKESLEGVVSSSDRDGTERKIKMINIWLPDMKKEIETEVDKLQQGTTSSSKARSSTCKK